MKKTLLSIVLLALFVASPAFAGDIYLTGTDAVSFHHDATYTGQIFGHLGSNILFLNDYGVSGATTVNGYSVTGTNDLSSVGPLTNFSGIFIASPGTCCSDPTADGNLNSTISANTTAINGFLSAGGNLAVEDFLGFHDANGATWTGILGFNPLAGQTYAGGHDCTVATAAGIALGFTGNGSCSLPDSYTDFSFDHQGYDAAFFAAQGYTSLLTNVDGSSALETTASPTPEPGSLVLLGSGLVGLAGTLRRKLVR